MDFVNDLKNHTIGERYIITDVSAAKLDKKIPADKDKNSDYKGFYYLEETDDDGYIGNALLISEKKLENLKQNAGTKPASLRLNAVLVKSEGRDENDDVYRLSLITKIEGLNKKGKVMWTALDEKPAKLQFVHRWHQ